MPMPSLSELNLGLTIPAISVGVWACILLLIDLWIPADRKQTTAWLAAGGLVFAFIANLFVFNTPGEAFGGLYRADRFSSFVNLIVLVTAFISILLSVDYLKRTGMERGEYYILLLLSTCGAMFMGSATDLTVVFVALELLSIPLYILAAFRLNDLKSEESGIKYFILGAFATAFFVFGTAMLYGATGETDLGQIASAVVRGINGEGTSVLLLLLGTGLTLVGLGFKVGVVPFHMWTPDVYEGAPTPVTAFMSVAAKAGGFAALLRILLMALPELALDGVNTWQTSVAVIAALTLILGNFVAIAQTNVKRLLAYSSIAHAGYIMLAVAAAGSTGMGDHAAQAALVYTLTYAFTNLGAFGITMMIEKDDGSETTLEDFVGLGQSRPALAFIMAVFMLSLTGIPLTAGFIGKWLVFQSAMESGLVLLAVLAVLTSVVSAFYYVRIIVNMYLRDDRAGDPAVAGDAPNLKWAVYIAFAATVIIGILPWLVTNLSDKITLVANILP